MKCPKCNEEALFVNGKYVCVDCGIEITPEEQANQYSSDNILDAQTSVSPANMITTPDPLVVQNDANLSTPQVQAASNDDFAASNSLNPVTEPLESLPVSNSDYSSPVSPEQTADYPPDNSFNEPTSPRPQMVQNNPGQVDINDQYNEVQATLPQTLASTENDLAANEIKKPLQEYYKKELENSESAPSLPGTSSQGGGVYDFSSDNNQNADLSEQPSTNQSYDPVVIPAENSIQSDEPISSETIESPQPLEAVNQPLTADTLINSQEASLNQLEVANQEPEVPQMVETYLNQTNNISPDLQTSFVNNPEPQTVFSSSDQAETEINQPIVDTNNQNFSGETESFQSDSAVLEVPNLGVNQETASQEAYNNPMQVDDPALQTSESFELPSDPSNAQTSPSDQNYFQPSTFDMNQNLVSSGENEYQSSETPTENLTQTGADYVSQPEQSSYPESPNVSTGAIPESSNNEPQLSNTENEGAAYIPVISESGASQNEQSQPMVSQEATPNISELPEEGFQQINPNEGVGFSTETIKNETPMPSVESVFGNGTDKNEPSTPQDYGLPAPKPQDENKKKIIIMASIAGAFVVGILILIIAFAGGNKSPYPIALSQDSINELSTSVTEIMDEDQDIAAKYSYEADPRTLTPRNSKSEKHREAFSKIIKSSGDWLTDKDGNIHSLATINGQNSKQTFISQSSRTFTYNEARSDWTVEEGKKINLIPSFMSPETRSSIVYATNVRSISIVGAEDINGVITDLYEINPEKGLLNNLNFLGPVFSGASFVSSDSSNLNVKAWIGRNDKKIYKIEVSGNLIIDGSDFSGEIKLSSVATYDYRSVLIKNPEAEAFFGSSIKLTLDAFIERRIASYPLSRI